MRCILLLSTIALTLAFPSSGPARARAVSADKAKARKLVKTAKALLEKKDLRGALRFFEQAYRYWANPVLQFNMAVVHLALGHKLKAAIHLRKYMKKASANAKARLPLALRKVLTQVAVLRIRAFASNLAIWVDGKLEGMGSVDVVVLPGKRKVELRSGADVVASKTLDAEPGETLLWSPSRPNPTPQPTPPASGGGRKRLHWAFFVVATGLALAAGGVVVGAGMRTLALHDEYLSSDDPDIQKQGKTMKAVTNAMIGVTAAFAVTAGILAIFTRWKKPEKAGKDHAIRLLPGVLPGGASLHMSLRF